MGKDINLLWRGERSFYSVTTRARYISQFLFSLCLNHMKTVCTAYFSENRDMSIYEF